MREETATYLIQVKDNAGNWIDRQWSISPMTEERYLETIKDEFKKVQDELAKYHPEEYKTFSYRAIKRVKVKSVEETALAWAAY